MESASRRRGWTICSRCPRVYWGLSAWSPGEPLVPNPLNRRSRERAKTVVGIIPAMCVSWLKQSRGKTCRDHPAGFAERRNGSCSLHLHGEISQRGRFRRAGEHAAAGGVGRELVEQIVA